MSGAKAEQAARDSAEQEFEDWLQREVIGLAKEAGRYEAWRRLDAKQVTMLESVEGTSLAMLSEGVIEAGGPRLAQDDYRIIAKSPLAQVTGIRLEVFPHADHTRWKTHARGVG